MTETRPHRWLGPRVAFMLALGLSLAACGSAGTQSGTVGTSTPSVSTTTSPKPVTAFGIGGTALGSPTAVVQMRFDTEKDYGLYAPAATTVAVGQIVEWDQVTLQDQEYHNVTFDGEAGTVVSSPAVMRYGSVWQVRFTFGGAYTYICTRHPLRMKGLVIVTGDPTVGASG